MILLNYLLLFLGGETIVPDPKEKMKYFRNQFKENGTNEKWFKIEEVISDLLNIFRVPKIVFQEMTKIPPKDFKKLPWTPYQLRKQANIKIFLWNTRI